ncbi:MAG: PhnA domain-containing protein [Bacteroidales bacterium]
MIETALRTRSENKCELCSSDKELSVYAIPPVEENNSDKCVLLCAKCLTGVETDSIDNVNHWRCLNDSAWSAVPAVQVLAWRMLHKLKNEGWANDLRDILYLDEETLKWAKQGVQDNNEIVHKDSNGATLSAGDTVVLIKDLNVKGAGFTAKRGTAVRNISIVHDNAEHIEGRVNGQQIVILTQYVKKN